jgi:hypothetical protein
VVILSYCAHQAQQVFAENNFKNLQTQRLQMITDKFAIKFIHLSSPHFYLYLPPHPPVFSKVSKTL